FVVQLAVLLFAVSFHESAHGWVALRFGDTTAHDLGRITMNPAKHLDPIGSLFVPLMLALSGAPVFGWAKPVPVNLGGVKNPRKANFFVSAAGPLSNVILTVLFAGAFYALAAAWDGDKRSILKALLDVALSGVIVNVSLAVFNMLPVPPLDGFGVVESFVPTRFLPQVLWVRRFGPILFLVLIFTGAFRIVLSPAVGSILHLLLGVPK
ncbi:MAG: site-2 protease family protein, partial [Acidobacteria bacterium]|nr:site-2 protease family protein [Acidobacteriota bacterium]